MTTSNYLVVGATPATIMNIGNHNYCILSGSHSSATVDQACGVSPSTYGVDFSSWSLVAESGGGVGQWCRAICFDY